MEKRMTVEDKISVNNFLEQENEQKLFKALSKYAVLEEDHLVLYDLRTGKKEVMELLEDETCAKRLRFKGRQFAFSLQLNQDKQLYVDHLLVGDIDKEAFTFSMRHIMESIPRPWQQETLQRDEFVLKTMKNNVWHSLRVNQNHVQMERAKMQYDYFESQSTESFKSCTKVDFASYHFIGKQVALCDTSGNRKNHWEVQSTRPLESTRPVVEEIIAFESAYPSITNYIGYHMPVLESVIDSCYRNETIKSYQPQKKLVKSLKDVV